MTPVNSTAELRSILAWLADARDRQRIVDAWMIDQISGEKAMELLVTCGLIEHVPPPDEATDG